MAEPPVTISAFHRSDGSNLPVQRIVIHTTSPGKVPYPLASAKGQARGTAGYFTLRTSGGSAHYITDVAEELHCLPDDVIAHHAPPNRGSIGIEVCGQPFYTRAQWLSAEVWPAVVRAQQRTIELCGRHKVPFQRIGPSELLTGWKGVCGHVDISHAWHQTDHSDPGPSFPWDRFLELPTHVTKGEAMARFPNAVDACLAPNGGVWVLGSDGGVGAYGQAPLPAPGPVSYPGLPADQRRGDRAFLRIERATEPGKLYVLIADDGSVYAF